MAFVSSHLCTLITSLSELAANARSFTWLQKLGTENLMKEKSVRAVEKVPCIRLLGTGRECCPLP